MAKMIIGITGTLGAGKGAIVDFLVEKGFQHHSVRSYLRQRVEERGLAVNRDSFVAVANELRREHSPSYIVEQVWL
jgi:dephospho-CoA kinase